MLLGNLCSGLEAQMVGIHVAIMKKIKKYSVRGLHGLKPLQP